MATTSDHNGENTMTMTMTMTMTKRATAAGKEIQQLQLACPRCDSSNTKFCYYNNYNFSQPRHFCKSCRRYWTHGGALRDIPVGGGSRRNSSTKRPRTSSSNSPSPTTPLFLGSTAETTPLLLGPTAPPPGVWSFGSLLTGQVQGQPSGFLALGGFGLGLEELGRGFGWASFPDHLVDDGSAAGRVLLGSGGGGHAWQLESGGGGAFVGDSFPWPDLAISTQGHGLK